MSIRKGNDIIASTPAVDTVPQQGSANVITSGGVYTALQDYVTLSTPQTITANKAFNGAKISTNSDIEFTSVVAGLVSNRNGTIRNLITRTNFNEVNVGNPYDPTVILGSGVRPRYNTIEYLALYSDIPSDFTGATSVDSGTNGLVPAPAAGDQGKFLQGDGTWATPTTATAWGNITGTLSSQTDLQNALDSKANTDLNNLTSTGANIGNWSHNVTNCITEIPQDIKLELNNGTLTLKAGSKVYVPNGVGVFDEVTVASDVSVTPGSTLTTSVYLLFYNGNTFDYYDAQGLSSNIVSGATDPMAGQPWHIWYDTTNNVVKEYRDSGSDVARTQSLPIAEIGVLNGVGVARIRKIFNGFGYIGSTVFALPGVKALIPDGRNDDGTLKNMPVTVSSVRTLTITDTSRSDIWVFLTDTGMAAWSSEGGNVREYKTRPASAPQTYVRAYIEDENHWIHCFNSTTWETIDSNDNLVKLFSVNSDANAKITGIFDWDAPFHAVDYNNTEFIGHQAAPSDKYVQLTFGASGSSYVAPADGYFILNCQVKSDWLQMTNYTTGMRVFHWAQNGENEAGLVLRVKKGDVMHLNYANNQNYLASWNTGLRFVYAVGAQ